MKKYQRITAMVEAHSIKGRSKCKKKSDGNKCKKKSIIKRAKIKETKKPKYPRYSE